MNSLYYFSPFVSYFLMLLFLRSLSDLKGAKIILNIAQNLLSNFIIALLLDSITIQKIIIFVVLSNDTVQSI